MTMKEIYHMLRRSGTPVTPYKRVADVHYSINRRAKYRAILDKCAVGGLIGSIVNGMDCDCTQYYRETITLAPKGAMQFDRQEDERMEWLDGPEYIQWVKPSEVTIQYKSADRALEAYEDGRPNLILWGAL